MSERQVQEQKILQDELRSVKKGATVYKQQQNSALFFKTTREKAFAESKKTLDDLVNQYQDVVGSDVKREDQKHPKS